MIITSKRAPDEWLPLAVDDLMAAAATDRLTHRSWVALIQGRAFRNPHALGARAEHLIWTQLGPN